MGKNVKIAVCVAGTVGYTMRPVLKGFIERPIKKMTVKWAPSYSGKGPFRDRMFMYIELKDHQGKKQRWPFWEGEFGNLKTGEIERCQAVTLGRMDHMPDDLFERPEWCKL